MVLGDDDRLPFSVRTARSDTNAAAVRTQIRRRRLGRALDVAAALHPLEKTLRGSKICHCAHCHARSLGVLWATGTDDNDVRCLQNGNNGDDSGGVLEI